MSSRTPIMARPALQTRDYMPLYRIDPFTTSISAPHVGTQRNADRSQKFDAPVRVVWLTDMNSRDRTHMAGGVRPHGCQGATGPR